MAKMTKSKPNLLLILFSLVVLLTYFVVNVFCESSSKCLKPFPEKGYTNTTFPVIHLTQLIPLVTARNLLTSEKSSNWTEISGKVTIPSSVESLRFVCSAKYRVKWGFESYPWITFNTWTGAVIPEYSNDSIVYTATIEFFKVQETSLQTRTPICYDVQNPCIQTAALPKSGASSTVDIKFEEGSRYEIQSKSEKEVFGSNQNCSLKFGYDPTIQRFYCQETNSSDSKSQGKIFLIPCPDPVSCESLVESSPCQMEPSFPISKCNANNRCRTETAYAGNFPGVAVCHSGNVQEHSAAIPYFYSLTHYNSSTNRTKRYLDWNNAEPNDMLEMKSFKNNIYTSQEISLECNASYFYLGSGMYFDIYREDTPSVDEDATISSLLPAQLVDDLQLEKNELASAKEVIQYEEANIGGIGSHLPLMRSLQVSNFIFDSPGRYRLSCFAPVWNTTEWAKAASTIVVQESRVPEFDGGNKTLKQYYAPNKRLECTAYGLPKPELSWNRDGGSIPNEIILTTGEQNQSLVWSILTFPQLKYGIQGNFTCTASNVAGTVTKSFIIIPPDSSTTLWVLIGFIVVVAFLIPLILFLSWKVRTQRKHIEDLTQEEVDEFINGRPDYIPFQCDMSTYAYYLPYDKSYEIPRESLEIDLHRILGSGEYGLVVYGLYKNANPSDGGPPFVKPVAIKTTKPIRNGKEYFKALLSELKIMTYIGGHPNIVNLVGACTQNIKKREVYIATEYCENGSLLAYLRMNRYSYENSCYYAELAHSRLSGLSAETSFITPIADPLKVNKDVQYVKMEDLGNIAIIQHYENIRNIQLQDLLQWSQDIASGMEFLAEKKIIHGDLAARNILMSKDFRVKIGDFGLSRQLYHYNYYTKTAVTPLPLKWLAIECLQSFKFSVESDVWAYGVTLFEIFSMGEIPYSSVQMNGEEFLRALKQGMRLSKPMYAPIDVFSLMMKCWSHDRKRRPNFTDILNFFKLRGVEDMVAYNGNLSPVPQTLSSHPEKKEIDHQNDEDSPDTDTASSNNDETNNEKH